jgi:hypothetical protein
LDLLHLFKYCTALHCTAGATCIGWPLAMLPVFNGVPPQVFSTPVVTALIKNKWEEFGKLLNSLAHTRTRLVPADRLFHAFQVGFGPAKLGRVKLHRRLLSSAGAARAWPSHSCSWLCCWCPQLPALRARWKGTTTQQLAITERGVAAQVAAVPLCR